MKNSFKKTSLVVCLALSYMSFAHANNDRPIPGIGGYIHNQFLTSGNLQQQAKTDPNLGFVGNQVKFDNLGGNSGRNRVSGAFGISDVWSADDQLSFVGLVSDKQLRFVDVSYQMPLGQQLTVSAGLSQLNYAYEPFGSEIAPLATVLSGTARTSKIGLSYQLDGLNFLGEVVRKEMADTDTGGGGDRKTFSTSRRSSNAFKIGLDWDSADKTGLTHAAVSMTSGQLSINPTVFSADAGLVAGVDYLRPTTPQIKDPMKTAGNFTRFNVELTRRQQIATDFSAVARAQFQASNDNLDDAEMFGLSGPAGVRGFQHGPESARRAGEAIGNTGWLASLELRQGFSSGTQGLIFFDAGGIRSDDSSTGRNMASAGLGFRHEVGKSQLDVTVAWPLRDTVEMGRSFSTTQVDKQPVVGLSWKLSF